MNSSQVYEKIELNNGEILQILDESRVISTDAWQVKLCFKIEIDVNKIELNDTGDVTDKHIMDKLGKTVIYNVERERNFIMAKDKETVFNDVKESFLTMNMKYLSHPKFALKYILKCYHEKKLY